MDYVWILALDNLICEPSILPAARALNSWKTPAIKSVSASSQEGGHNSAAASTCSCREVNHSENNPASIQCTSLCNNPNMAPMCTQMLHLWWVFIVGMHWGTDLEQVQDLLAQVQLEVCVVGSCHVVDEHQAIPLGLKTADVWDKDVNVWNILTKGQASRWPSAG